MIKRWRFRKVTPRMKEEMKELFKKGKSYSEIAKIYRINWRTVRYWVDEEYRKKCIERAKRRKVKKELSQEERERRREYFRNYMRERYHSDPEFRSRLLRHMKKWQKKKKERALKCQNT